MSEKIKVAKNVRSEICELLVRAGQMFMESEEFSRLLSRFGDGGGTVVKVLCYKSEGRWFDSRWCHWNFSLT